MFRGDRSSPTDYDRRRNARGDNGSKGWCVRNVANLAGRGALGIFVVMPQAHRRSEEEEHQGRASG
jgi:hypothetical protein